MAIASIVRTSIDFSGDYVEAFSFPSASNAASPGAVSIYTLSSGANTITLPTGGSTVLGATIIPPAGNTQTIIVKGVSGDTGVQIHKTNPTSITFDSASIPASIILTAGGTITGLKIVWI